MSAPEPRELAPTDIIRLLSKGELEVQGSLPWGSNFTLLSVVQLDDLKALAVYKPRRGERPLWDFPRGTLCQREVAAYLLSELLGWSLVPPTVLRDGPYGVGSVQFFIDADEEAHLLTMQKERRYAAVLEQLAVFDVISNNADRKSGHCLKGRDGRLWAIDHGICFHYEEKLRTVLWDYAGETLPDSILYDLKQLRDRFVAEDPTLEVFSSLLSAAEVRAVRRRLDQLINTGRHVDAGPGRNIPWPPI